MNWGEGDTNIQSIAALQGRTLKIGNSTTSVSCAYIDYSLRKEVKLIVKAMSTGVYEEKPIVSICNNL